MFLAHTITFQFYFFDSNLLITGPKYTETYILFRFDHFWSSSLASCASTFNARILTFWMRILCAVTYVILVEPNASKWTNSGKLAHNSTSCDPENPVVYCMINILTFLQCLVPTKNISGSMSDPDISTWINLVNCSMTSRSRHPIYGVKWRLISLLSSFFKTSWIVVWKDKKIQFKIVIAYLHYLSYSWQVYDV